MLSCCCGSPFVCVPAEAAEAAVAAADLTHSLSWHAGTQQDNGIMKRRKRRERGGSSILLLPFTGTWVNNGLTGSLRQAYNYSCGLLRACQSSGCSAAAMSRFKRGYFVFYCRRKEKRGSEACEQILGWAHWKNIKNIRINGVLNSSYVFLQTAIVTMESSCCSFVGSAFQPVLLPPSPPLSAPLLPSCSFFICFPSFLICIAIFL